MDHKTTLVIFILAVLVVECQSLGAGEMFQKYGKKRTAKGTYQLHLQRKKNIFCEVLNKYCATDPEESEDSRNLGMMK
ncbi:hypothetical protein ABFA07_014561 [Porites harrisoni]